MKEDHEGLDAHWSAAGIHIEKGGLYIVIDRLQTPGEKPILRVRRLEAPKKQYEIHVAGEKYESSYTAMSQIDDLDQEFFEQYRGAKIKIRSSD